MLLHTPYKVRLGLGGGNDKFRNAVVFCKMWSNHAKRASNICTYRSLIHQWPQSAHRNSAEIITHTKIQLTTRWTFPRYSRVTSVHSYRSDGREYWSAPSSSDILSTLPRLLVLPLADQFYTCIIPVNERRRYSVTPLLICWAHTQNHPW